LLADGYLAGSVYSGMRMGPGKSFPWINPFLDRLSRINDDLVEHLKWLLDKKAP
jgi:hypothetical protein